MRSEWSQSEPGFLSWSAGSAYHAPANPEIGRITSALSGHSALPVPLAEALGHRTDRVVDTEMEGVRKVKGGPGDACPTQLAALRAARACHP